MTVIKMLRQNLNHACGFFAIDFKPRLDFVRKLSDIAESVGRRLDNPIWSSNAEQYVIRDIANRYLYVFNSRRLFCQTLGLEPWTRRIGDHSDVMNDALKIMDVVELKRVGFQVNCWLSVEMTHAEMVDLLYGSFLANSSDLEPTFGKIDDALIQIHGSNHGMKSRTVIAPQTVEDVETSFSKVVNLELFVENKLIDPTIREFRRGIERESLYMEIDLSIENSSVSGLRKFMTDSLEAAEKITEGSIAYLRSLPAKRSQSYGKSH
jgi:hypothetical protein